MEFLASFHLKVYQEENKTPPDFSGRAASVEGVTQSWHSLCQVTLSFIHKLHQSPLQQHRNVLSHPLYRWGN